MKSLWILAQTDSNAAQGSEIIEAVDVKQTTAVQQTPGDANSASHNAPPPRGNPWMQMLPFILIIIVFYFLMLRGPQKQKAQQQQMIKNLKKNDRIQTVGGILGTVLEVSENEVTIKIDESNNTKIRIVPSAVGRVIEQK